MEFGNFKEGDGQRLYKILMVCLFGLGEIYYHEVNIQL